MSLFNSSFHVSDFYSMTILYNLLMKNNNSVEFNESQDVPINELDFSSLLNMSLVNISDDYYNSGTNNHFTYQDFTQIPTVRVVFLILYMLIMFLALFGNSVICYTVISNRKMQTVVNCYIVNLAICDFLVGAFVLPVKLLELMAPANWFAFSDGLCTAMLYLQTVIVFSSVLTLVAICLERYFAILHPLKSRINKSRSRTLKIILMTYVIPALGSLPFLYPEAEAIESNLHSTYGTISRLTCLISFDPIHPQFRKGYYTFLFITFYVLPLAFIGFTCFCIARSLFKITALNRQGSLRRQEINRRKIGRMILIVVMAYTISWTPYFIVSIITQYQEVNFMQKHNFYFTMLCINLFAFLNSSINPFIYAIMSTRFRNGFMRILRLFFCISDTKSQDIANNVPRRRMPKPLSYLNKYHRQVLMFACGEPSQLSTDSSTQHNDNSKVNPFVASFRCNLSRRFTLPTNISMARVSAINHNNVKKRSLDKALTRRFCAKSVNNNDESIDGSAIQMICTNIEYKGIAFGQNRTGSESILPLLERFWELNLKECEDSNCCKNIKHCKRMSSTSLPDLLRQS